MRIVFYLFIACFYTTAKAQLNIDSVYQTDYLQTVFQKAELNEDSLQLGIAAYKLHQNLSHSNEKSPESLQLITLSMKCFKAVGDSLNYYNSRIAIVSYYFDLDRFDEIVRVLLKNLDFYQRHDNQKMQVHTSFSLARAYYGLGKIEASEKYYNSSLAINKVVKDTLIDILSSIAITQIHQSKLEFTEAISTAERALELSQIIHNLNWLSMSQFYLGMNHQFNKDYDIAIDYFEKVVVSKQDQRLSSRKKRAFWHLSKCYEDKEDYQLAQEFALKYIELSDSIWKNKNKKELNELTIAFEVKEKQAAIDYLENKNLLAKQSSKQKNRVLSILSVVLLVLFFLLGLVFYFYRDKIKKDKIINNQAKTLSVQKIQNLENSLKLSAVKSMLEGQEKERARIARDIHDSLGGLLGTIKLKLQNNKIQNNTDLNFLLDRAASEVRAISQNLQPHALEKLGLISAIDDLINSKKKIEYLPEIDFQHYNVKQNVNPTIALQLYRIIQEALNNTLKHAKASGVLIQLNGEESGLSILLEDNGVGFDKNEIVKGQGLENIRKRAEFLQADLNIQSDQKGTSIFIFCPYKFDSSQRTVKSIC